MNLCTLLIAKQTQVSRCQYPLASNCPFIDLLHPSISPQKRWPIFRSYIFLHCPSDKHNQHFKMKWNTFLVRKHLRETPSNGTQKDNSQCGMHVVSFSNVSYKKSIFEADPFLLFCFVLFYCLLWKPLCEDSDFEKWRVLLCWFVKWVGSTSSGSITAGGGGRDGLSILARWVSSPSFDFECADFAFDLQS